jgi:hypothetical protein
VGQAGRIRLYPQPARALLRHRQAHVLLRVPDVPLQSGIGSSQHGLTNTAIIASRISEIPLSDMAIAVGRIEVQAPPTFVMGGEKIRYGAN